MHRIRPPSPAPARRRRRSAPARCLAALHQQRAPTTPPRRLGSASAPAGRQRQRRAGQEGHHRLLRPRGRPRLDRRHHQQRQGAGGAVLATSTFKAVEGTNDVNQQISQVETLINEKVDAIVLLPNDGKAADRRSASRRWRPASRSINLDREFSDARSPYRTWIGGDNYGMGVSRRHLHRRAAEGQGRDQPGHRRDRRASTACR